MGLDLSRLSIVVVEDNEFMRHLVVSILKSFGVSNVFQAEDAHSGFNILYYNKIDVVISDWEMAEEDGITLLDWVRTRHDSPDKYLPFIMLTAYTEQERVALARDKGVTEFLAKPFTPPALMSRLTEVIEAPRPFVRTRSYFGPDRRRLSNVAFAGRERRADDLFIEI